MRLAPLLLVAACAHPKPPTRAPEPVPVVAVQRPVAAPSRWPVPVRVMAWNADGLQQLGTLPDAPPATYPALWFIEPMGRLDAEGFAKLARIMREDKIPGLSLHGQSASLVGALVDLPELRALLLDDLPVLSSDLVFTLPALERLYLARTQIDDRAIEAIRRHDKLKVLDVEDTALTDAGLAKLVGLDLHALDVAGTRITDAGGVVLGKFPKLAILDVGGTKIGAKTVDAISKLALTELFIDHTFVGKEIAKLAPFAPGIVRFDASMLASYKPTDADVEWLAKAPNLIEVGLSNAKVHDKLVLAIAAKPNLKELKLASTEITATGAIPVISKLTKLEEVDLANLPVDDVAGASLLAMPGMRVLRLDGTQITDGAMKTASPKLVELYVSRTKVTDAGLAILDTTPKLEALGLGDLGVTDVTLARIVKLRALHTLVLSKAGAAPGSLASLGVLTDLGRLYLDDTRTDDDVINAFTRLTELRALHLAGTQISDASLPILRSFRGLDELTIGDTRLTKAVADLEAWPQLRTLSMLGLQVRDSELPSIVRRSSLVTLDLSATDITDPSPLISMPKLRLLGLSNTLLSPAGQSAVGSFATRGIEVVR